MTDAIDSRSQRHKHLPSPDKVIATALIHADIDHSRGVYEIAGVALSALKAAGYTLMKPVCEACDAQ